MEAYWSLPIALQVAAACLVIFFASKALRRWEAPQSPGNWRYEWRSGPPMPHKDWIGWKIIERLAAVLGVLSFIIQIGQWAKIF
jgi:hypothetical protein